MICAVHALVGAVVGRVAGRRPGAIASGVATHLIGDLIPHKDLDPKVEAPLLAGALGWIALRFGVTSPEFLGAVGGMAPDIENAAMLAGFLPREKMRFPTHLGDDRHGPKISSALPQALIAGACLLYLIRSSSQQSGR